MYVKREKQEWLGVKKIWLRGKTHFHYVFTLFSLEEKKQKRISRLDYSQQQLLHIPITFRVLWNFSFIYIFAGSKRMTVMITFHLQRHQYNLQNGWCQDLPMTSTETLQLRSYQRSQSILYHSIYQKVKNYPPMPTLRKQICPLCTTCSCTVF